MAKTWSTRSGETKTCGGCGSVYSVTLQRVPMRDSDYFNCEVCGQRLQTWNSTEYPEFTLIHRGQSET